MKKRRQGTAKVSVSALIKMGIGLLCVMAIAGWWGNCTRHLNSTSGHPPRTGNQNPEPVTAVELTTERQTDLRETKALVDDPSTDNWQSEALAEAIAKQLKSIGTWIRYPNDLQTKTPPPLVSPDFSCTPLSPGQETYTYQENSAWISRATNLSFTVNYRGTAGLHKALLDLVKPFHSATTLHSEFKTFSLDWDETSTPLTRHHVSLWGHTTDGSLEQNATWECEWVLPKNQPPSLRSIELVDFEQARVYSSQNTWFSDCTEAVLGHNTSFHDQLVYGLNFWLQRIERIFVNVASVYGITVGDVNGDGLDDVYICQTGNIPNRLLVQNPDGTATDRSAWAGVDWLTQTSSALLVDLDNDGDQDLCAAMPFQILVMENNGSGQFTVRSVLNVDDYDLHSLTAADYDNDGDLDLYQCVNYASLGARPQEPRPTFIYHDANDGGANALFRNDIGNGSWTFVNVTQKTGMDANNRRHSLAASWEDYDNDGDQDLYVGNDFGKNCLYRNDEGSFVELAEEAGVTDQASGMSVSWADLDRDGDMDLHVANMFSYAGSRVTRQAMFQPDASMTTRAAYQRFSKGNTLFKNLDSGKFTEISSEAAVQMGRWAWGSVFTDLNNDGWEDLVVANGYFTTQDTRDL